MGKMHGGLARSGKVRNQTPKVDKQERTKKPLQGRAKKRMLYKRRFLNIVKTPGKKRGPNAQSK